MGGPEELGIKGGGTCRGWEHMEQPRMEGGGMHEGGEHTKELRMEGVSREEEERWEN